VPIAISAINVSAMVISVIEVKVDSTHRFEADPVVIFTFADAIPGNI